MAATVCLLLVTLSSQVQVLGKCPVDSVSKILAGNFVSPDDKQFLVVEEIGDIVCQNAVTLAKVQVYRLVLLHKTDRGYQRRWQSELFLGRDAVNVSLLPDIWASGDVDGDSLLEIVTIKGDSGTVLNLGPDSLFIKTFSIADGVVIDALCADMELDGFMELVTLEQIADSTNRKEVIRVWQIIDTELRQRGKAIELPDWEQGMKFSFLGSARLEDYPGAPVLVLGEYPSLRPSRYYALYPARSDSFVLTATPFPYQEWFSKEEVLAAGRLQLFNVGDTLVAYGYFVPGTGGGSGQSFAALQDGEWRVLRLKEWASKLVGPVCKFGSGWLGVYNKQFYFITDEPFYWR
ncbi:MAG: hypothetical protein ABIK42_04700 [candidate division WOR-3 bacterium]